MAYVNTINAIWVWGNPLDYDPTTVANRCISGKIDIIIPVLGHWNSNGSISLDQNQTSMKNWISTVKSKNPNFKVLGNVVNVSCYFPGPVTDISTQAMRITMVNNMVNCVNTLGLDGFNEDTECAHLQPNGYTNLADLWNKMGVAMKNINKISSACAQCWGEYITAVAKSVTIDYLFPMLYGDNGFTGSTLKTYIHDELVNSNSPLILGLGQWVSPPTLSTTLSSVDTVLSSETNKSKLRGFCIFEYSTMTGSDWTTWNNWPTKNPGITTHVLTSIAVSPTSTSVGMNGTVQLTATCKDQNNATMTCPTLTWTSSNTSKATVDSTGKVTGIATGTTNVTAKSGTITSNVSTVTVTSSPVLTSIVIAPGAVSVNINGTTQLGATCKDQNSGTMTCPAMTWTSSDSSKATVNSTGTITGVATGTTNVRATSGSIVSNTSIITVSTAPSGGIVVTNPTPGLVYIVGESRVVRWTHTSVTGANVKIELLKTGVVVYAISSSTPNDDAFSWTVPNAATGNDYQIRVTSTTSAQYTGISSIFTIQGSAHVPVLTSITVAPGTSSVNVGASVQLGATCKDQNGTTMTCPTLTWTSSDTTKVAVDITGKVTGIAAGTTSVRATSGSIVSNTSVITVTQSPIGKKFSVYDVTPDTVVNNVGVMTILDPVGTLTKDQACVEVCNRLGQI